MDISQLSLKIIILLIPGAISSIIYERLTIHKKTTSFHFIARSILFGASAYVFSSIIFNFLGADSDFISFWQNLENPEIRISIILKSIIPAILISYICAGIDNWKLINRLGQYLHLSTKYGDENLFSYFLNLKSTTEIYLRDIDNNITYHGIINQFSETNDFKEIVLSNVKVYSYDSSELCYEVDRLYLCKPKDDLVIEVPIIK